MIKNNIGEYIKRHCVKQYIVAEAIKVNNPVMSQIVNGVVMPEKYQLDNLCKFFKCEPTDLYSKDLLDAVYNSESVAKPKTKKGTDNRINNRVRIAYPLYDKVAEEAQKEGIAVYQMINKILIERYFNNADA